MRVVFILFLLGIGLNSKAQYYFNTFKKPEKQIFLIEYVSGAVDTVNGYFKKSFSKSYIKLEDRSRVYPEETNSISLLFGVNEKDVVYGKSYNDYWMFEIFSGDISGANRELNLNRSEVTYLKKDSIYFQFTDKFYRTTFLKWISDDADAVALYKKDKRRKILRIMMPLSLSGAFIVASAFHPVFIVFIPFSLISLYIKRIDRYKIIEIYNSNAILKNKDNVFE